MPMNNKLSGGEGLFGRGATRVEEHRQQVQEQEVTPMPLCSEVTASSPHVFPDEELCNFPATQGFHLT